MFAKNGLVDELKKALSERLLNTELDEHLVGDAGRSVGNHRNGKFRKTMLTGTSKVTLDFPRDRNGTFDPKLIAKYQRRFPDFDDKVISMYARGMSVREIRAVEVTGNHIGDAPVLPDLLSQIAPEQEIGSVTVDGAYDTRNCHDAIADRGAHAVIPPRKNAKPWKPTTAGAVARNEALRASKSLGRTIWRDWSGYHRRSRAETKIDCMKLLGQRLMARDFDRQVAEVQVRIAIMNGYTALGIPVTKAVG
ncbi:Transposase, Mutator family [Flavimaricola marinus]|uniref:Transposase, Mutator family n=1 Tax=Flavimaricola marinus TaxID=1819565 RepID=A0A238LJQ3_9RHOB|nr:Transposase, Mutator family [Flavimaricola marinus]